MWSALMLTAMLVSTGPGRDGGGGGTHEYYSCSEAVKIAAEAVNLFQEVSEEIRALKQEREELLKERAKLLREIDELRRLTMPMPQKHGIVTAHRTIP